MTQKALDQSPVIIVGAGRSGTTMLKEALGSHRDVFATEFELNPLWRVGNAGLTHDLLTSQEHGAPKKTAYIRKTLSRMLKASGKKRLVEKTVANIMRLGYIHSVLPDAKIIHIVRDGRAVTASAVKRWQAKPQAGYLARKSLTVPLCDLPFYGIAYLKSKLGFMLGRERRPSSWGPRWPGMADEIKTLTLPEICARQWQEQIKAAFSQKKSIPSQNYLEVKYEDLVKNPSAVFDEIAGFIGLDKNCPSFRHHITHKIKSESLDRWKKDLNPDAQEKIMKILKPTLKELGYE